MELYFFFVLIYPAILLLSIVALIRSWKKSMRNSFRDADELSAWMILLGAFFTSIAPLIGFLRFDAYGPETPFSEKHVLVIELLVWVSAACYWISKFAKKKLSPAVNLLLRAGLIQGIVLDMVVTVHFLNYIPLGLMLPLFGFELLVPPVAMLFLLYELQCNFKCPKENPEPPVFMDNKLAIHLGAVLALIVVQQALLLPVGSEWHSLVSAFTESKGFIFSNGYFMNPFR